ncbi:hypothetical protein KBB17_00430 [Candidatus Saccharibacteria bacterium]|jgi:Tfp pilus assembly protein PilX|nr:hypothetical protein [Candidatus Saccharibacteria bacterium]MBP9131518.1 hypothetical protein [Candidatus Saccharibacteria bacterium]
MKKINNQRGVVSFFTVIFVTMLLLIMTTAFIRLMVNEQRQSTDNDLSNRAFYAAESGVNDAILQIKEALEAKKDLNLAIAGGCGGSDVPVKLSVEANISYTCQLISLRQTELTGSLKEGENLILDLTNQSATRQLEISWHLPSENGSPYGAISSLSAGQNLSSWGNSPAIVRLQAITFPDANINSTNLVNRISYAYPTVSGTTDGRGKSLSITKSKGPNSSTCYKGASTAEYVCRVKFTNLGTEPNKFLRIQMINNKAEYKASLLNEYGAKVDTDYKVATIDVTGKAGSDVFRRVRVTVPINFNSGATTGYASLASIPDQVLMVDTQICKSFDVDAKGTGVATAFGCNNE